MMPSIRGLGLFKFSEKKEQRNIIEDAKNQISRLRDNLSEIERKVKKNCTDAMKEAQKNEPQIRKKVEAEHRLPYEPSKTAAVWDAERRLEEEKVRLEKEEKERKAAEKGISVSAYDLLEILDVNRAQTERELSDYMICSTFKVRNLLKELMEKDLAVRYVDKRVAYYKKVE